MRYLSPLLLGVAAAIAIGAAPAHALQPIEPVGPQLRLSQQGADGDFTDDAIAPDIAYNPKHDEFLEVFQDRTTATSNVFARRLAGNGTPIGAAFKVGDGGRDPAIAYDPERDRYIVGFTRPTNSSGIEVFLQFLSATGAPLKRDGSAGTDAFDASSVGISGDPERGVLGSPDIAYVPDANGDDAPGDRWVLTYSGDDANVSQFRTMVSSFRAANGAFLGEEPISSDSTINAFDPVLADIPGTDEVAVAWFGALAPNAFEIFASRVPPSLEPADPQRRISAAADALHNSSSPAIAADAEHGQLVVAFSRSQGAEGNEIYVQRLNFQLDQIGADDEQLTVSGPAGSGSAFSAGLPAIAYMPSLDRYLVTWVGNDNDRAGLANNEREVSGTVIDANGVEGTPQDFVISHMGEDGKLLASPFEARAAANTKSGRWLPIWTSDDARAPLADDESELWGRLVGEDFDGDRDGVPVPQDCDDAKAAIHPGATDVVDNGIDENCDGADAENPDRDGDRSDRPADCDDANPFIHPGAADIPGNGTDEDCSGRDAAVPPGPIGVTRATIARFFAVFPAFTKVTRLEVKNLRPGMRIVVRCAHRGCPEQLRGKGRTVAVKKARRKSFTKLFRRARLRPRGVIEVRVFEPGAIARVDRFVVRDRRTPKQVSRCLPPGASRPGACPR
jgi:hypothetical protein